MKMHTKNIVYHFLFHKDLTEKLPYINYGLYEEVEELLTYNKKIRHIRGGEKTKEKYQKMKVN